MDDMTDLSASLVYDKAFSAMSSLLVETANCRHWHSILSLQQYPDPSLLLHDTDFSSEIASLEPGRSINYIQIRKDLISAQNFATGGAWAISNLFRIGNELVQTHIRFVRAHAMVLGYQLYARMIDHFYSVAFDDAFNNLVARNVPCELHYEWPTYSKVKEDNMSKLHQWEKFAFAAGDEIAQLKSSDEVTVFLESLQKAIKLRDFHVHSEQRHASMASTCQSSRSSLDDYRYERLYLAKRKATIARRKTVAKQARLAQTCDLRDQNVLNQHQWGEQAHILNSDATIQRLLDIQTNWQERLAPRFEDEVDELKAQGLNEDEAVGVLKQAELVQPGCMLIDEGLAGIVVPPGFHAGGHAGDHGTGGGHG